MDSDSPLKVILLEYIKKVEMLKSMLLSYDRNLALHRKRKKENMLILQKLRKQQLLVLAALQQNATQRSLWKLNRQSVFWEEINNSRDEQLFRSHFRMTRASFDILCGFLNNLAKSDTNWRNAIPLAKRVAIALFALGSSGEYRVIAALFGVGKSTVCTILLEFCEGVWEIMSTQYIKKIPPIQETVAECINGFRRLGFPQCLGAIGGCHIKIRPNLQDATDYCNNKGWHSIVFLALVDYRYRFLYVNIGSPARYNVSQIYNASRLKKALTGNEILASNKKDICGVQVPVYIIGDSAFPFSTTVMKPYAFTMALTEEKKLFNYKMSKCRGVVENAFGHLKARFRLIGKGIDNRIGNAPVIIRACCVLHNFLNERSDEINQVWLEEARVVERNRENPTDTVVIGDNEPSAESIREALSYYLSK